MVIRSAASGGGPGPHGDALRDRLPAAAAVSRRAVLAGAVGLAATAALPVGAATAAGTGRGADALPRGAELGTPPGTRTTDQHAPDAALAWLGTTYDLVLRENLSPPAAARAYAYTAIAMHEAVVAGTPGYRSLAGRLTGLTRRPPLRHGHRIDWPAAAVAAAAGVLRQVLPFASSTAATVLADAEQDAWAARRAAGVGERELARSVDHGRDVARHLARWIARDGYAATLGRPYTPPRGEPWHWESTPPNFRPAIEPYWSEVRPLALRRADEVAPEPPVPFSTEPGSAFHEQAMAPYRQSMVNTDEHRAIARFWTDNPGSFTPPLGTPTGLPSGHWMLIAQQGIALRGLALGAAVEVLAATGIALHDAFLSCWTWKYRYNLLRPVTYIQRYVDPTWVTFVNTPQFPEHTSGHSVASPAAAAVLTDRLGTFPFTDHSHATRGHAPRTFASFDDAAREAAQSRLYGGIHYPHAIAAGLTQGEQVGALVLARLRTRR